MVLDARIIRQGHSTIRQSSDLEAVRNDLPPFSDKIECYAEIDRTGPTIYARIQFKGMFELQCARCLEKFQHPVSGDIRLILKEQEGRQGATQEGDIVDLYFDSQHSLVDVSPAIYDEIMTSLPLKPLCVDTCKGIVFKHKDDNLSASEGCERECDPRWEALRKLQKKI